MAAKSEDLTTFASRFGAYKWKGMPFGLCGGPASWQRFINDVLWEHLNKFCTAHLDDIQIYSTNLKEHKKHVRAVLAKLREAGIQADVDKCFIYELIRYSRDTCHSQAPPLCVGLENITSSPISRHVSRHHHTRKSSTLDCLISSTDQLVINHPSSITAVNHTGIYFLPL